MARAEILCVGSELLSGKVNTHAAYLAPRLKEAGLSVAREQTLEDDLSVISSGIGEALRRSDAVIVCGGLGPTFDDISREAAAEATGRRLIYRASLYSEIRRKYRAYGFKIPSSNRRQAWLLDGARALRNPHGSAPGQHLVLNTRPAKHLFLLPGPFDEMRPMFERLVLPQLHLRFARGVHVERRVLRSYGLAEAAAGQRLAPTMKRFAKRAEFTILASLGQVELHVSARGSSQASARRLLDSIEADGRRRLGRHFFGVDGDTQASVLGEALRERRWTLGVAESCTGGLLAKLLTDAPGSSDYFWGGVAAYANSAKERLLSVSSRTLKRCGAVSEETALEMASGAKAAFGSDCALAVTGVAGPGGGTKAKPVGHVCIAWAAPKTLKARTFRFHGNRAQVRQRSAQMALYLLTRAVSGK